MTLHDVRILLRAYFCLICCAQTTENTHDHLNIAMCNVYCEIVRINVQEVEVTIAALITKKRCWAESSSAMVHIMTKSAFYTSTGLIPCDPTGIQ